MLTFLRLIKGYVIFEATGGFCERFLNLCKINGINLWNVKNDGVSVVACTSEAEFKMLNIPAENSGMSIKTVKTRGFIHFLRLHKWRCGIAVGFVCVLLFVLSMSMRIWNVEIVSINGTKLENFSEAVNDEGIKTGVLKSSINNEAVQEKLLSRFPELAWVSVNIFGSKVQVEYMPAQIQTPFSDTSEFTNVVAEKAGEITLLQCYRGEGKVKKGDYVPKGTLLISGIVKNADKTESITHASGKVFAKTKTEYKFKVCKEMKAEVTTAEKSVYLLNFFNLKIPLGIAKKDYEFSQTEILLKGNNTSLPVGVNRNDYINSHSQKLSFTEKECKYIALAQCIKNKREGYENAQFESITYREKNENGQLTLIQKIVCVEDIALEIAGKTE